MKKQSNFFSYIWGKMKHNWGLKILSLLVAIVLWNMAVIQDNPEVTRTYPDIPITVVGDQLLKEKDLALVKSWSSYAELADVTININRNDRRDFDESTIGLQLDLSSVPGVGTHEIILKSTSPNVKKISPESITVVVEERVNSVIPVECEVVGTLLDGYHRGSLIISPNTIQVSGAKSIVGKIEKAYMRLDLTDMTDSVSLTKDYTFIDSNGSAIDPSALDVSFDSVAIEMSITPVKNLLIIPKLLGQENIKEGYQITSIKVEPDTVQVTGVAELLEGLTSVSLEGIQIAAEQYENVFMQEIKIQAPDGITLLGAETATVHVQIEEQMSEKIFEGVDIELRNIPDGLESVDFAALVDITVIAPTTLIDNIVANHITLYVDMTGAVIGETELPILFEAPEEYRVTNVIVFQDAVTVTLK